LALLGGLFGYTLAAAPLMFDLGRYWNAYNILLPWQINPSSVMFEVAICMLTYIIVLWLELSPTFLDRLGLTGLRKRLQRYMYLIIALGVVLPTMHQSSFGSVLLVMGSQLSPLWYTTWLPLLFLLTALAMGYSVVILESTLVTNAFALPSEQLPDRPLRGIPAGKPDRRPGGAAGGAAHRPLLRPLSGLRHPHGGRGTPSIVRFGPVEPAGIAA
jgi:Ni/Fe-hydrogenase subunit HybB-like protein